jgi:hypothetical protein
MNINKGLSFFDKYSMAIQKKDSPIMRLRGNANLF